jgi:hypothetical protein
MPTDTLKRFREEALRRGGAERKKRQGELLEGIRADGVALIALASAISSPIVSKTKRLEQLLEEIRAAAEELRAATEAHVAAVLALADMAAGVWEERWKAALRDPAVDRAEGAEILQWVLEDAGEVLQEALQWAQQQAHMSERPLARLDELKARAAEFPLWARECLARWEMLGRPAPPLDPERIARAQAAFARGEHEGVDDVLSRVQAGGPWVKE